MSVRGTSTSGTWRSAFGRATILLAVSVVVFLIVPDRLIAYLSLHVAPASRDALVTLWTAIAFVLVAYLLIRLQRGKTA